MTLRHARRTNPGTALAVSIPQAGTETVAEAFTYNKDFQRGDYSAHIHASDGDGPFHVHLTGPGMKDAVKSFQTPEAADYFVFTWLGDVVPVVGAQPGGMTRLRDTETLDSKVYSRNPVMDPRQDHKLLTALTEYDRKQSKKKGYNIYALPQYMTALQYVRDDMAGGMSLREALVNNFHDRLLVALFKGVGEPRATDREVRGNPALGESWRYGPYNEFSPAHEKATDLQSKGHHVRYMEPEYGERTGWKREWWIHGSGDAPAGSVEEWKNNPGIAEAVVAGAAAGTAATLARRVVGNPNRSEWAEIAGRNYADAEPFGHKKKPSKTAVDQNLRMFLLEFDRMTPAAQTEMRRAFERGRQSYLSKVQVYNPTRVKGNPDSYPDSPEEAAEMYETFHGRPSGEVVTVEEEEHYHEDLTALGELTELKVLTESGYESTIDFSKDSILLTTSEDGRQLYFVGGNQKLNLSSLHMNGKKWRKDLMVVGRIKKLTYRTEKKFDNFKEFDYFHNLGEDTGVLPILLFDTLSDRMKFAGGQYETKAEGLTN